MFKIKATKPVLVKKLIILSAVPLIYSCSYLSNKRYSSFPENVKCDYFSLEVRFICLPNKILKKIEDTLKKYQIVIQQLVESNYAMNFDQQSGEDIFLKTKNIIEGSNSNEVTLLEKTIKNKGFFERFFNLFS